MPTTTKHHFFDLDPATLADTLASLGMPRYRADQLLEWVYRRGVTDPAAMTNLSKADREKIAEHIAFTRGEVLAHQVASDGVQKLLVGWRGEGLRGQGVEGARDEERGSEGSEGTEGSKGKNRSERRDDTAPSAIALPVMGNASAPPNFQASSLQACDSVSRLTPQAANLPQTECVMIPAESLDGGRERKTACISSQVGCPVGCKFCASGIGGLESNLTAGQIVEQVWRLGQLPGVGRITNVVFMGMGEPLANFENVVRAIRRLTAEWGMGISARRITVSTVGVPSSIRRLADADLPVTLALSLHAPNDAIRKRLIPWAQYVTIDQLLDACDDYFRKTGREITLEYTLLGNVNDRPEHARELSTLARRLRANINLIRYNEVRGMPFARPATDDVRHFQTVLRNAGINVHIRASRGRDIAAACGQLRHEHGAAAT